MFDKKQNKNYKEELEKRYCYLYENVEFILAPFVYRMSKDETKKMATISSLDNNILNFLEELLLSDIPFEETNAYLYLEKQKEDKDYLEKVKQGIEIKNVHNEYVKISLLYLNMNILKIFENLYEYIQAQTSDLKNKDKKLQVIDEYARISRYENNGKIWTSGVNITITDMFNHNLNTFNANSKPARKTRKKDDIGITNNKFINYFSDTSLIKKDAVHFTEEEKQKIYLKYHDEIPCNIQLNCTYEDIEILRPENTKPCGKKFILEESEIFTDKINFYQLCSHCGYIVKIPCNMLPLKIKERIIEVSSKEDIEINYISSEIQAIKSKKRLLKK